MTETLARKKFTEFKERTAAIEDAELDDYWASLPPATVDGMLGEWKGGEFVTGHRMNGQLEKIPLVRQDVQLPRRRPAAGLPR